MMPLAGGVNTSLRLPVLFIAIWTVACTLQVADDAIVDTVRVTDTLVRVETLLVRDTNPGTGPLVAAAAAAAPAPVPGPAASAAPEEAEAVLRGRQLMVPVAGVSPARLTDTYHEKRGSRIHEAVDIAAPRGTAVVAADDGSVAKLLTSDAGGLTIYVADRTGQLIYYYAHLDSYRPGLREGMRVRTGDVLGTVGTTGNAPANVPHLHFATGRMDARKLWYRTTPIDPRPYLTVPGAIRTP